MLELHALRAVDREAAGGVRRRWRKLRRQVHLLEEGLQRHAFAKAITDVPGSSQWFESGVVTYSNAAKTALLGVPATTLAAHGAVSEATVRAMVEGARQRFGTELAVAVSGIAGPDGGTRDKPVGTVWLAWATPTVTTAVRRVFTGGREAVRRQSVALALERLVDLIYE